MDDRRILVIWLTRILEMCDSFRRATGAGHAGVVDIA